MKHGSHRLRAGRALGFIALAGPLAVGSASPAVAQTSPPNFLPALYAHIPFLRYDSHEEFFPVRVKVVTNNTLNRLIRDDGSLIAQRGPISPFPNLTIDYLKAAHPPGPAPGFYPSGDRILDDDRLDLRGGDPDDGPKPDAAAYQANPLYQDRIYGRVVYVRDGGQVVGAWLQYWVYYYFNDVPVVSSGDHESDWEMVQVRVNANSVAQYAVYAQHGGRTRCGYEQVEKKGLRPVVYVAHGTHASYFRSGFKLPAADNPHVPDVADGAITGRKVRGLIRIGQNVRPKWVDWPGYWGNSRGGIAGTESPHGPKFQSAKWSDPESFGRGAPQDRDCR